MIGSLTNLLVCLDEATFAIGARGNSWRVLGNIRIGYLNRPRPGPISSRV